MGRELTSRSGVDDFFLLSLSLPSSLVLSVLSPPSVVAAADADDAVFSAAAAAALVVAFSKVEAASELTLLTSTVKPKGRFASGIEVDDEPEELYELTE